MKGERRLTGLARIIGLLIALALLISLILPLVAAAQEADDEGTTEALAEVPSSGASRRGPVILASSLVPAPEPAVVEGITPVELQVDSVGIYAPIEVGAIADGVMLDPSGPWVVAWYDVLGKIGEGGNIVMAGHVDYYTVGPAVFWQVPNLPPGEVIRLVGEDGNSYEYVVEWTKMYDVATELTPEVIQSEIVGDTGEETLTLITCGGEFNPATSQYLQRWVVRATRI
jgi:hypothetical protein